MQQTYGRNLVQCVRMYIAVQHESSEPCDRTELVEQQHASVSCCDGANHISACDPLILGSQLGVCPLQIAEFCQLEMLKVMQALWLSETGYTYKDL